jgi:GxxExxY protein
MHAEHADSSRLNDLLGQVTGCASRVLNALGAGFLETVYENALARERHDAGLAVQQQCSVKGHDDRAVVGKYSAALLVEDVLFVE